MSISSSNRRTLEYFDKLGARLVNALGLETQLDITRGRFIESSEALSTKFLYELEREKQYGRFLQKVKLLQWMEEIHRPEPEIRNMLSNRLIKQF